MEIFGYIRVSTKDQHTDRQAVALSEFSIPKKNLYIDKQSGKDFLRPAYRKMMRRVKRDDLIIVKSIDRLGRNYDEILEQWRIITREKGADIKILDMPLLDTTHSKDILGTFIADLVLQVLSFCAHSERENIHIRQMEGIRAAKARGVQFGRSPLELPDNFVEIVKRFNQKEISEKEAIANVNISRSSFYKYKRLLQL